MFAESLEEDDESTSLVELLFGIYRDINFINVDAYNMKFSLDIVSKAVVFTIYIVLVVLVKYGAM